MENNETRRLPSLVLCASLLVAAGTPAPELVGNGKPADTEKGQVELGALSYRVHCTSCHGSSGMGDGSMAEVLKIAPADLTRLASADGGEFPTERVYRVIDGRDEIRGHGSRRMPVWGLGFQDRGKDSNQEPEVRAKILDVIAYLKTIQVVEEAGPDD